MASDPSRSQRRPAHRQLSEESVALIDAYWRASNYLSVGQIYLLDNPLLRQPHDDPRQPFEPGSRQVVLRRELHGQRRQLAAGSAGIRQYRLV